MPHSPASAASAIDALNRRYLQDYPAEAARRLEQMPINEAAGLLDAYPPHVSLPVWSRFSPGVAEQMLQAVSDHTALPLLTEMNPSLGAALLLRLDAEQQTHYLQHLPAETAAELRELMSYPADTAGHLMNPRVMALRIDSSASEALGQLRKTRAHVGVDLPLINESGKLAGFVRLQDIATARPGMPLQELMRPLVATIDPMSPREDVVEKLERHKLSRLPVVDMDGRLMGVIQYDALVTAVQEEASLDIQTMVGASKDERALSSVGFAVRKRLPWLEINLLTAFLAASVVGLFEDTIAQFTALAVLLPVVAGQSGNTGAQALAVTMRGLALREIRISHWLRVMIKEVNVGMLNGVVVALTTSVGVWLWSQSLGLALVIGIAMVISMMAAGFAGAVIPIALTRVGQDPAQSSSIILTTVTDVVGFMTFLGIASLLSSML